MLSTVAIDLLIAGIYAIPIRQGAPRARWIRGTAAQTDACAFAVIIKFKPSAFAEPN